MANNVYLKSKADEHCLVTVKRDDRKFKVFDFSAEHEDPIAEIYEYELHPDNGYFETTPEEYERCILQCDLVRKLDYLYYGGYRDLPNDQLKQLINTLNTMLDPLKVEATNRIHRTMNSLCTDEEFIFRFYKYRNVVNNNAKE